MVFWFICIIEVFLDCFFMVQFYIVGIVIFGQDYEILFQEVMIFVGEVYYDLLVNILYDNLVEFDELLWVVLDILCVCYFDLVDFWIVVLFLLEVELDNIYVCLDEESMVGFEVLGGIGLLSYVWFNGVEMFEIMVFVSGEQMYSVVVSDQCGQEVEVFVNLLLCDFLQVSIFGMVQICVGELVLFFLNLEGILFFVFVFECDGEFYVINLGEFMDQLFLL